MFRILKFVCAVALWLSLGIGASAWANPIIVFNTNAGNIEMELVADEAPDTVDNFLNYLSRGDYVNTIFHRAAEWPFGGEFVLQGGGFRTVTGTRSIDEVNSPSDLVHIATDPPIGDEPGRSNQFGTVAMAKNALGATSEFFVNMRNNDILDAQRFSVFAIVQDMAVATRLRHLSSRILAPA